MPLDYLDFDLTIERFADQYRARVLSSPAGQASTMFSLPSIDKDLKILLLSISQPRRPARRQLRLGEDVTGRAVVQEFGGNLYQAIFGDEVGACLRSSLVTAAERSKGLRIRLRLTDAPELGDLPWEYLYNRPLNRFLSLSVETPLVRYLELPEFIRPLAVQPPLRVLAMISNPSDQVVLNVEEEWTRLREALWDLEQRGLLILERLGEATLPALQTQLRRAEYHIFHYIGHGAYDEHTRDGMLLLENAQGRGQLVRGADLGIMLHDARTLRLAVLNACEGARTSASDPFAGTAQSLVQQGIPAVIAMQFEITDVAAITLAHGFYSALVDGYPVDAALGEARKAIFGQGNEFEWGTPVLHMRAPDGVLFAFGEAHRPALAAPAGAPVQQTQALPGDGAQSLAMAESPEAVGPKPAVPIGPTLRIRPWMVAVLAGILLIVLAVLLPGPSAFVGRALRGTAEKIDTPAPVATIAPSPTHTLSPTAIPIIVLPSATLTSTPSPIPTATQTPQPVGQKVIWEPALQGGGPGITIGGADQGIPWSNLESELVRELLPQLTDVPTGSVLRLGESQGQANTVVQVLPPAGAELGRLWFGPDLNRNGTIDGLIRFGKLGPKSSSPARISDTFQRYSDGTYQRMEPWFGPISFCLALDAEYRCKAPLSELPAGTSRVYISWEFAHIPYGATMERKWYHENDQEWSLSESWSDDDERPNGVNSTFYQPLRGYFLRGIYRLDMYLDGQLLRSDTVRVGS